MISVGSDFSGVGAFDQALMRLGIDYKKVFACDWDKYARQTYIHNYGGPDCFPMDVYDREIPTDPLDIYMTSPPCQAFSLAGKRKGEDDKRGVLFYNSHEFIKENKPRYFIFENVKGLLSSKSTITYQNSLYLLLYNFKQIKEWESLEYQKNNLNLLSQSITNYLCLNYAKKLGLRTQTSGMSYTTNSELGYEKLENLVKNGLKRRSKFLEERICQITKKSSFYPQELTAPLGCKEEDLVLNQNQSYLIENLIPMVTNLLEKTVGINVSTSLFAKNILEDNSKNGKWYTTLTELNLTIDSKIFMYVLELNIIRLIILALDLSSNLWKEIWHILIGKKEFTGLKTFDIWLFNLDHLNYHIYYKVLNAKNYGIPQNRERVFIVGIRDDVDNYFTWPKEIFLEKRLRDVLEPEVDEKYYLSDDMLSKLILWDKRNKENGNGFGMNIKTGEDICNTISTGSMKSSSTYIKGYINQDTQASQVYSVSGISPNICAGTHGYANGYVSIKSATSKGYEVAEIGEDSINFEQPNSETRRGRVGKGVAQTITTGCQQGVAEVIQINPSKESGGKQPYQQNRVYSDLGIMTTLDTDSGRKSIMNGHRIRRLTPRECFRLMDFDDSFTWPVSDSQAYKQAGNSICVGVLAAIIGRLKI